MALIPAGESEKSRMEMVRLGSIHDFADKPRRNYRIMGRPVAVFREEDGTYHALEMACRHQGADLTGGRIKGDVVTCPWHNWQFNIRTGECIWGSPSRLRPYACELRGEEIYISLTPLQPAPPEGAAE